MAARSNAFISIIESGDSYRPLIELMGSEMIEVSLDSDATINAWDLPKGELRPNNDKVSYIKNLARHMLGENTPPDLDIDLLDSVLLDAIVATYTAYADDRRAFRKKSRRLRGKRNTACTSAI